MPIRFRKNVPTAWLRMTIREGRNRQVRRMTAAVGHPTLRLVRVAVGPISLADLAPGQWRELTAMNSGHWNPFGPRGRTGPHSRPPANSKPRRSTRLPPSSLQFASPFRIDRSTLEGIRSACSGPQPSGKTAPCSIVVDRPGIFGSTDARGKKGSAMASPARVDKMISLEEFLRMPEIDEHPYLEYIDGRIEAKVSPQKKHGRLEKRLMIHIDAFSEPQQLGETFPELRCTFAGRSIIPDVVFLLDEHIETDERGRDPRSHISTTGYPRRNRLSRPVGPEMPGEVALLQSQRLPAGLADRSGARTVQVYRRGRRPQLLSGDGILEGDPVLPGYHLPLAELFGWLKQPKRNRKPSAPRSEPPIEGEPS